MLRRLDDLNAFGDGFAPILTRRVDGEPFSTKFAVYRLWLKALLPTPEGEISKLGSTAVRRNLLWLGAGAPGEILAR